VSGSSIALERFVRSLNRAGIADSARVGNTRAGFCDEQAAPLRSTDRISLDKTTARSLKKLTPKAVRSAAHCCEEGGLDRALYEKSRPGTPLLTLRKNNAFWRWMAAIRPNV
jgi:hypothetical protein